MERKINEPFKDQRGKMVKAVLADKPETCFGCCYKDLPLLCFSNILGGCSANCRSDNQDVIFKEVTE